MSSPLAALRELLQDIFLTVGDELPGLAILGALGAAAALRTALPVLLGRDWSAKLRRRV